MQQLFWLRTACAICSEGYSSNMIVLCSLCSFLLRVFLVIYSSDVWYVLKGILRLLIFFWPMSCFWGSIAHHSPPLFILLCTLLWCWTAAVGWTGGLAGNMALSCLRRRDEPRHRPCPATRGLLLCFQGNQVALSKLDESSPATTTHRS